MCLNSNRSILFSGSPNALFEAGLVLTGKKGENNNYGSIFTHHKTFDSFFLTTLEMDEIGNYQPDLKTMKQLNGEKVREIGILLPFNSVEANFPHFLASYKGHSKQCHSVDGKNATRAVNGNGKLKNIVCNPEHCPEYINKRCQYHWALSVILMRQNAVSGVYRFQTTSIDIARAIYTSLNTIQIFAKGLLTWIPLKMKVAEQWINNKEGGKEKISVVQIYYSGTPAKLSDEINNILQLKAPMLKKLIPSELGFSGLADEAEKTAPEKNVRENEEGVLKKLWDSIDTLFNVMGIVKVSARKNKIGELTGGKHKISTDIKDIPQAVEVLKKLIKIHESICKKSKVTCGPEKELTAH